MGQVFAATKSCRTATMVGVANAPKALPTQRDMAILGVIDSARDQMGITQQGLALAIGLSQSQVSRIFSGQRPATLPELLDMCGVVGMTLSEVAQRAGEC